MNTFRLLCTCAVGIIFVFNGYGLSQKSSVSEEMVKKEITVNMDTLRAKKEESLLYKYWSID